MDIIYHFSVTPVIRSFSPSPSPLVSSLSVQEKEYVDNREKPELPVRWCAPEVLESMKYSEESDVYSFGMGKSSL